MTPANCPRSRRRRSSSPARDSSPRPTKLLDKDPVVPWSLIGLCPPTTSAPAVTCALGHHLLAGSAALRYPWGIEHSGRVEQVARPPPFLARSLAIMNSTARKVLLIVLLLVVCAGAGWYAWHVWRRRPTIEEVGGTRLHHFLRAFHETVASITRSFPDDRPLGSRQRLQELNLPTRGNGRNEFPLKTAAATHPIPA